MQNNQLKTKLLLIGTRTAASVFLHANYEDKTLLGEFEISKFGSSVRNAVIESREVRNKIY